MWNAFPDGLSVWGYIFKTAYPTHNLDRARTQFKLVWDMEQKWEKMQAIAEKYKGRA